MADLLALLLTVSFFAGSPAETGRFTVCGSHRQVFWSSEGTAWTSPLTFAYVTGMNPLPRPQKVWITVWPDPAPDTPTGYRQARTLDVPPHGRYAINVNDWFRENGLGGNRNFATEVVCDQCSANIAIWNGTYTHVSYPHVDNACELEPGSGNPYLP